MAKKTTKKDTPQRLGELLDQSPVGDLSISGEIGQRIIEARGRKGFNQSDLSRKTGLSRTVINGYEKGRRSPGAREIRLLCDALSVSPNELLYGRSDHVPQEQTLENLLSEDATANAVLMAVFMKAVEPKLREAITLVMRSLVEYRHGKPIADVMEKLMPGFLDQMKSIAPDIEKTMLKSKVTPAMRKAFDEANAVTPNQSEKNKSRKRPQRHDR